MNIRQTCTQAMRLDQTHNPNLRSWVEDANGHPDFPIQNLPLGIFSPAGQALRPGIAIGDHIFDLEAARLLEPAPTLNAFLALGQVPRQALRQAVSSLLAASSPPRPELLHRAADCTLHLPAQTGDYTDFYAGIHHAENAGRLFRPDSPLLPNYKWVPIGYHGRASSIRPSGTPVRRPSGQRKRPEDEAPTYGPTRSLDFELELGIWTGPGNPLGEPIPIAQAHHHIAGYSLLNDWSARDLQAWEYQPLGPFLGKSFHTSVSPWMITPEALAPFRAQQPARPTGDPSPLPYLQDGEDQRSGALDLTLEVLILTPTMRAAGHPPARITRTNTLNLYWTPQQLLTHQASNAATSNPETCLAPEPSPPRTTSAPCWR